MQIDVNGQPHLFQWEYITDPFTVMDYLDQHKLLRYGKVSNYGAVTVCTVKTKDTDGKWQETAKAHSIARIDDLYYGPIVKAELALINGREAVVVAPRHQRYFFDKGKSRKLSFKHALTALGLPRNQRERAWAFYLKAFPVKRVNPQGVPQGLMRLQVAREHHEAAHV